MDTKGRCLNKISLNMLRTGNGKYKWIKCHQNGHYFDQAAISKCIQSDWIPQHPIIKRKYVPKEQTILQFWLLINFLTGTDVTDKVNTKGPIQ